MTMVRYYPTVRVPRNFSRPFGEFDRWFKGSDENAKTVEWCPRADVVENDDSYAITLELPGIEKDDVNVSVENNVLSVSGESKSEHDEEHKGLRRVERRFGSFSRSFRLPEGVDAEKIGASFKNGLLTLTVEKAPEIMPKRIDIA